jgi:hypothetical protein
MLQIFGHRSAAPKEAERCELHPSRLASAFAREPHLYSPGEVTK